MFKISIYFLCYAELFFRVCTIFSTSVDTYCMQLAMYGSFPGTNTDKCYITVPKFVLPATSAIASFTFQCHKKCMDFVRLSLWIFLCSLLCFACHVMHEKMSPEERNKRKEEGRGRGRKRMTEGRKEKSRRGWEIEGWWGGGEGRGWDGWRGPRCMSVAWGWEFESVANSNIY